MNYKWPHEYVLFSEGIIMKSGAILLLVVLVLSAASTNAQFCKYHLVISELNRLHSAFSVNMFYDFLVTQILLTIIYRETDKLDIRSFLRELCTTNCVILVHKKRSLFVFLLDNEYTCIHAPFIYIPQIRDCLQRASLTFFIFEICSSVYYTLMSSEILLPHCQIVQIMKYHVYMSLLLHRLPLRPILSTRIRWTWGLLWRWTGIQ